MSEEVVLTQIFNRRVEIGLRGRGASLVYRHEPELPKPAFHPVTTPRGVTISGFEMSDHVWHRGLWFTIKLINGVNFWEELPPFGRQTAVMPPVVEPLPGGEARLRHELSWSSQSGGEALRESRRVDYKQAGAVHIVDWQSALRATGDLTLDRTPFTTWGGYGGLAFRGSRELHNVTFQAPGAEPATALAGAAHPWCVMNAQVDGGTNRHVWMGIADHPENPRSPTPWYCKTGNGFTYMNPAFLFHEPMILGAGHTLVLRYRVAWGDGLCDLSAFAAMAGDFQKTTRT